MANESWLNKTAREVGQGLLHWDEARRKQNALDEIKAVEARIASKQSASSVPETPVEQDDLIAKIKKRNKQIDEAGR